MRLVQLANGNLRSIAMVEEPHLILLNEVTSIYQLAQRALTQKVNLTNLVQSLATGDTVSLWRRGICFGKRSSCAAVYEQGNRPFRTCGLWRTSQTHQ